MSVNTPQQIVLDVDLPDEQTFDTLVEGENTLVVAHCQSLLLSPNSENTPFVTYISGASASGKSHLLVAMCHQAAERQLSHFYLCLSESSPYPADMLNSMENLDLLCIDNIHLLESLPDWQRALFDLINRINETQGCKLVVSANQGPLSLNFDLADLKSRLSWGVSFNLVPLGEKEAEHALEVKARHRGLVIAPESLSYLVTHSRRDMHSLTQSLEVLQQKSLQQKRKISIPFIKQTFDF
ncbi:DnaA regulatory inactivator Hda [Aliiglaciecola litoralis]|uniref:DnaA inactivator Hda n=1 Tax=Aliiglaciecola litoralis TaxID=582857 RepID=A0ABN1LCA2_9ALTE